LRRAGGQAKNDVGLLLLAGQAAVHSHQRQAFQDGAQRVLLLMGANMIRLALASVWPGAQRPSAPPG
jgi:hypothetical protein